MIYTTADSLTKIDYAKSATTHVCATFEYSSPVLHERIDCLWKSNND